MTPPTITRKKSNPPSQLTLYQNLTLVHPAGTVTIASEDSESAITPDRHDHDPRCASSWVRVHAAFPPSVTVNANVESSKPSETVVSVPGS